MKKQRKHGKPDQMQHAKSQKRSKALKKENSELDNDLKDTFPASDAITKY